MPALQPYLIEPIRERFWALLPEPETNHPPLGCHRPRVSDRAVFEKLVQVSVFDCAYERIADELCSATTLRRRRDEWIEVGPGRASAADLKKRTLTNLYNERPTWLANAHARLDRAVFAAYGWPDDLADEEVLGRLLALNADRSERT